MISVIIPTYNRSSSIEASVMSVLNQTISDIEVIIVDDGSTDNTIEVIERINDPRIRFIQQNHLGACAARNTGIDHARGEYIAFHDSDDTCRINRLQIELDALLINDVDFVCGNVIRHFNSKKSISPGYSSGILNSPNQLFNITTMTFFGKSKVFKQYKFDPNMPRWQDLDYLLSIYSKFKIYFTDKILCDYYRDEFSLSSNPEKCIEAFNIITNKHQNEIKSNHKLYSRLLKIYADSKVALDLKDHYSDYKLVFRYNKTIVNFIWLTFARFGAAKLLYNYLHNK